MCFSFKGQNLSHTTHSYSLCVRSWETFSCLCFHSPRWEKANRPCWKLQQICCLPMLDQLSSISTEIRPSIKEKMDGAADSHTPKGVLRGRGSKGGQHWRPERRWGSGVSFPLAHDSFNLTTHAYWFSVKHFSAFKKGLHFQPNITSPGLHVLKFFLYKSCPASCFFLSSQASLSKLCIIKIASFSLSRYKS